MTEKTALTDYQEWKRTNGDQFSLFDYVYSVNFEKNIKVDYLYSLYKVMWPDFLCIDGMVFLSEQFDDKKYNELIKNGLSPDRIEYWINLFSIDSLFPYDSSPIICRDITQKISSLWRRKMSDDFPFLNIVIDDEIIDDEQSYISFYQKMEGPQK